MAETITSVLPGSKWSCLLLRIVLQDATSEVAKVYLPSRLKVFVDDTTAFMEGRNKELAGTAEKVLKSKKKCKGKGFEVVNHRRWEWEERTRCLAFVFFQPPAFLVPIFDPEHLIINLKRLFPTVVSFSNIRVFFQLWEQYVCLNSILIFDNFVFF